MFWKMIDNIQKIVGLTAHGINIESIQVSSSVEFQATMNESAQKVMKGSS